MRGSLFALFAVVIMLGAAVGPAIAASESAGNDATAEPLSVSVGQVENVTVTVTENGTGVADATVNVSTVDANATYAGTGTYTTDANGTVVLPTPNETVAVSVTATVGNDTATTSAVLRAENASFGDQVSALARLLQTSTDGGIGQHLAAWIVATNPGNAPAHAGPPDHAGPGNDTDANETGGPPAHAGPPDHAGGNGNGPPEDAGPGGDEDDSDDADD